MSENKSWLNGDRAINIIGIIISLSLGIIAIIIAYKSEKESVSNVQFVELLEKTTKVISTAEAQLKLSDSQLLALNKELIFNKELKKINDSANKYRFIASVFKLGANLESRNYANQIEMHKIPTDNINSYLNRLIPILESQMNNPYLCQNDSMLKLWINAYVHLNMVKEDVSFTDENGNIFTMDDGTRLIGERESSSIDEISKIKIDRNLLNAWDALHEAYLFCGKTISNESARFIKR